MMNVIINTSPYLDKKISNHPFHLYFPFKIQEKINRQHLNSSISEPYNSFKELSNVTR